MSVHISSRVWRESKAKGAARLVLLSLADQANDDGECYPKVEQIAERCQVSRRSVTRYVEQLVELGELEVTHRRTSGQSSIYRVIVGSETPRQTGTGSGAEPHAKLAREPEPDWHGARATPVLGPVPTVALQEPSLEPSLQDSPSEAPPPTVDDVDDHPRPEVLDLCQHLADWIVRNGNKPPAVGKRWHRAMRLLIDIDGRTPDQIRKAIDWSQQNPFWSANILSAQKLREKYDTLRARAAAPGPGLKMTPPTPRSPRTSEQCTQPGHSGWANNCAQCRADRLARKAS